MNELTILIMLNIALTVGILLTEDCRTNRVILAAELTIFTLIVYQSSL